METHSFDRHLLLRIVGCGAFVAMLFLGAIGPAFAQSDSDGDGLFDDDETSIYHTDPDVADTDGDGSSDGEEVYLGTDPLTGNAPVPGSDRDGDGLFDVDESKTYGTNPDVSDTDGDGVGDGEEVNRGTDPLEDQTAPLPTGPTGPLPTGVGPLPTGVGPLPTGVGPLPTGVGPLPTSRP